MCECVDEMVYRWYMCKRSKWKCSRNHHHSLRTVEPLNGIQKSIRLHIFFLSPISFYFFFLFCLNCSKKRTKINNKNIHKYCLGKMINEKNAKKVSALSLRFIQCNAGEYVWTNEQKQRRAKPGIENDWNSMRNINRTFIRSFIRIQTHTKVFNLRSFFVHNFLFWYFTRISCFFFLLFLIALG